MGPARPPAPRRPAGRSSAERHPSSDPQRRRLAPAYGLRLAFGATRVRSLVDGLALVLPLAPVGEGGGLARGAARAGAPSSRARAPSHRSHSREPPLPDD